MHVRTPMTMWMKAGVLERVVSEAMYERVLMRQASNATDANLTCSRGLVFGRKPRFDESPVFWSVGMLESLP